MNWQEYIKDIIPLQNKLFRFALRMLNNRSDAEDLVQDTILKVWRNQSALDKVTNIEAWCIQVAKNLSLDKIKKEKRRGELLNGVKIDTVENHSPYHYAATNDTLDNIDKIVQQLSPQQKITFQLREVEEMTYQEIADIMEIPMNQVKTNIHRARKIIRQKIQKSESYGL